MDGVITLDTWGLHSINKWTCAGMLCREHFVNNQHLGEIDRRDVENIKTGLRVYQLVMNVLGYIPMTAPISGCVRMSIGILFCLHGAGSLYWSTSGHDMSSRLRASSMGKEMLCGGVAQAVRGAFEALVPFGWALNVGLDVIATPINIIHGGFSWEKATLLHLA